MLWNGVAADAPRSTAVGEMFFFFHLFNELASRVCVFHQFIMFTFFACLSGTSC